MKKLFLVLLVVFAIPSFINAQTAVTGKEASKNRAEFKVKTFFHCENGKKLIEEKIASKEDIYSVNADLETKVVTIVYNPQRYNENELINLIHEVGYLTEKSPEGTKIEKACSHH